VSAAVISVASLLVAVYFYAKFNSLEQNCAIYKEENARSIQEKNSLQAQISVLAQDKSGLQGQVSALNSQIARARRSSAALDFTLNSFMYAGDIKAQAIGSKEAAAVESAIVALDDGMDRISAENNWNEFEKTKLFNPLFGLLRGLAQSAVKTLQQPSGPDSPAQMPAKNN